MGQLSDLGEHLLKQHGPLIGNQDLTKVLGFRTSAAMKKAIRTGHLRLNIFHIEGRRGVFCLTTDVAAWLQQISAAAVTSTEAAKKGHP